MKALGYIKQNYWLLIILLGASALRLFRLDFQSVWMDEIYTLKVSDPSQTAKEMHDQIVLLEGFPYLYFWMLRAFYAVFGYTELVARLLSAFAGIAGVGAIYVFGKNIFNRQVGLFAAFLLAINEFHIAASQEARPYTLFVLFALIAFYRLSIFIKEQSLKNAIWFGLAAGLMLNINFFALFTLFAQALILLFVIIFSTKEDRLKLLLRSALAGIIAILMFVPNYAIFQKLMNFQSFWVPAPQADSYGTMFKEFLGNSEITRFIFLFILFYYAVNLFKEKTDDIRLKTIQGNLINYGFVILFFWFMSYFGLLYAKSYYGTSLVLSRYFITLVPVVLLALAMGIYLIRNKVAKAAVIVAILYFAQVNLIGAKKYYSAISKSQYREVSAYIKENNPSKAPVYTSLKFWYDYFLERGENKQKVIELPLDIRIRQMIQQKAPVNSFWYADAHNRPYSVSPEVQAFLDEHFVVSDSYEGFDAWARYFERKGISEELDIAKFGELKAINGNPVSYNLDIFEQLDKTLKIRGWAFFSDGHSTKTKINLVLVKDGKARKLSVSKENRPDVSEHFKMENNGGNLGFTTEYNLTGMEPGQYTLGIHLADKISGKEGLIITDKTVQVH